MAKAQKETRERERIVREKYQAVVLEMSEDEALFLADIFSRIGGHPDFTRRRHQESLTQALRNAGVQGGGAQDIDGGIRMLSGPRIDPWADYLNYSP